MERFLWIVMVSSILLHCLRTEAQQPGLIAGANISTISRIHQHQNHIELTCSNSSLNVQ